ncbi:hypothetical protein OUZ56_011843 [Daphnia magna]|uniref:Uncharacterized protein n=1 Tax=Daphnia magna TaxID=35525 RepID=A0ABQ9Z2L5_9CRUS|nr:hypothetical protein OUZ56_011843 [Daphnia magna]
MTCFYYCTDICDSSAVRCWDHNNKFDGSVIIAQFVLHLNYPSQFDTVTFPEVSYKTISFAPVLLIPDSRQQQMTQNDMLLLLLPIVCDSSAREIAAGSHVYLETNMASSRKS